MRAPQVPRIRLPWVVLGGLVVVVSLFGVITEDVLDGGELVRVDNPVSRYLLEHRTAGLTAVMRLVTDLGSALAVVPLILVVGLLARRVRGTWRPFTFLGVVVVGATLTSTLIKIVVARPRPTTGALVRALGFAFPSGHSTAAAAAWLAAAVVLGTLTASRILRAVLAGVALAVVLLVGVSRIYLGVHAPTDVLGGWALGAAWLLGTLAVGRSFARRRAEPAAPFPGRRQH